MDQSLANVTFEETSHLNRVTELSYAQIKQHSSLFTEVCSFLDMAKG